MAAPRTDYGTGAQMFNRKLVAGRPISRRAFLNKALVGGIERNVVRYQEVGNYRVATASANNPGLTALNTPGKLACIPWLKADGSFLTAPLFLFDVTSTNNVIGGAFTLYNPAWQLAFATAGGLATNVSFINPDSSSWLAEDTTGLASGAQTAPFRRTLCSSVQAKLLMYGNAAPVTFTVQWIQLNEDWLHPDISSSSLPAVTGENYRNTAIGFWQYMVKREVSHPIAVEPAHYRKMYKVLKTERVVLQPKLSTENDPQGVGHHAELDCFYKMNRVLTYDWQMDQIDPNFAGSSTFAQNTNRMANVVEPKKRVYLLVKAGPVNQQAGAASANGDTIPSFDIVLRKNTYNLQ